MNKIKLQTGNVYIIKKGYNIEKVLVLELTETTVYLQNLDHDSLYKYRVDLKGYDFNNWIIVEDLGNNLTLMEQFDELFNKFES